jgi:ATP-dependent protease ClpP protease subunit
MYFPRLLPMCAHLVCLWLSAIANAAQFDLVDDVVPGQKMIMIRGEIVKGDDFTFFELSKQVERASIFLESPGGDVETGLSIGSEIAIRGFTTLVLDGSGCHSICAVIWVSGVRRYMSPNAEISVHAAYSLVNKADGTVQAGASGIGNASIGAYLNEIGLSRQAIEYFTTANPGEPLLPIKPNIAQALDIDVFIIDDDQIVTPADRPTPRRINWQVNEYIAMSYNCSDLLNVDPEFFRARGEAILKSGHELFGGEVFVPLLQVSVDATKSQIVEQGVVRWCIQADANLRADGLDTGVSGPSFDCSLALSPTEQALCASKSLWTLDRVMANIYFHYKKASDGDEAKDFLNTQRNWLKRRDACGDDVVCLSESYSSRLFDFGY